MRDDGRMKITPSAVVILRILLTPLFFFTFMWNFTEIAMVLYLAIFASDIIDGVLARRQEIVPSSTLEAYLDSLADFVVVLVSFYAFSLKLLYPLWLLLVLVVMFLFFIISSNNAQPLYDPFGKYYGTFLMITIGVTLFFPTEFIFNILLLLIIVYTIGLVIFRTFYLWKNQKENEGSTLLGG